MQIPDVTFIFTDIGCFYSMSRHFLKFPSINQMSKWDKPYKYVYVYQRIYQFPYLCMKNWLIFENFSIYQKNVI